MARFVALLLMLGVGCIEAPPSSTPNNVIDIDSGEPDTGTADMSQDLDIDDCFPESNAGLCLRSGFRCGEHTLLDRCGDSRTIICGVCEDDLTCNSGFQCDNAALTDAEFCLRNGAECGSRERDGDIVDCGSCSSPETCGGEGLANICGCEAEADATFCERQKKQCGSIQGTDNCGNPRTAVCGTCTGTGETCQDNACVCTPSSTEEFCASKGAVCGSVMGTDNCGATRQELCGDCSDEKTCQPNNTCAGETCAPESDEAFCTRYGKNCGSFSGVDSCTNTMRTANCGSACDPNESCVDSVCVCSPLTQCPMGQNCGSIPDGCGGFVSCGSCNGPCNNNVCTCTSPTDAQLCASNFYVCGSLTVAVCGTTKTVDCGACLNGSCLNGTCGLQVDLCGNKTCSGLTPYCVDGACCSTMAPCI